MSLTYQDVINRGILDQLATVYRDPTNANVLLASISFPTGRIPPFTDPMNFWSRICELIRDGVSPGGFEPLLQAAAWSYPGNPAFTSYAPASNGHPRQPANPNGYVNLLVPGDRNPRQLLDLTRRLAQQQDLPQESAILRFANAEGVLISLNGWTIEQALELSENLTAQLSAASQQVRPTVTENRFEDYLIRQLFVEGPDQARFEINDIRASTLVRDIAQGVISTEYDQKTFGRDAKGRGREVVIDRQNPDGSTERLNPDSTLHDQIIQEGDTVTVSPVSSPSPTRGRKLQVFLCHSSKDKPIVRKLYQRLLSDGFQPWLDEEDILPGQNWERAIEKAVRSTDIMLVCLTQDATTRAGYIHKEIKFALDVVDQQPDDMIFIIPVKLEECNVPDRLSKWQWIYLTVDDDKPYQRLVSTLKKRAADLDVNN